MEWKDIPIFISSTFNDMHAERDYLVKYVFPELAEWCAQRRLRLIDIDLRWGVTKEESETNNALRKCLENIEDCRPFFLCLIGQRRGWVPNDPLRMKYERGKHLNGNRMEFESEISEETKAEYPSVKKYDGKTSVTEMEIEHALLAPMYRVINEVNQSAGRECYAVFFERESGWLTDIVTDIHRRIYTNDDVLEWGGNPKDADSAMLLTKARILEKRPVHRYTCAWKEDVPTPELAAEHDGEVLSKGRLADFSSENKPWKDVVIEKLQAMILEEYDRRYPCVTSADKYEQDREQQELFAYSASEGYIKRTDAENVLDEYLNDSSCREPFLIKAKAGLGKTTLLSHYINNDKSAYDQKNGIFRFCGASDLTTDAFTFWNSICIQAGVESPETMDELRQNMPRLLFKIADKGIRHIIIDAVNQMSDGERMLDWIPQELPQGLKLVLSVKIKNDDDIFDNKFKQYIVTELDDESVKENLIDQFLHRYLKTLDKEQKKLIFTLKQSNNPLFLKILLHELHFFGSYKQLADEIKKYKNSPKEAFDTMLERLQTKSFTYDDVIISDESVPFLFGLLSQARNGLSEDEMIRCFKERFRSENKEQIRNTIRFFLRQVRPFLARREGRVDFLYESFCEAVSELYPIPLHDLLARSLYVSRPAECVYHARTAGNIDYIKSLYSDIEFLNRFYQQDGAQRLRQETLLMPETAVSDEILGFITETVILLEKHPKIALATFFKELSEENHPQILRLCKTPWLRMQRMNPSLTLTDKRETVKASSIQELGINSFCFAKNTKEVFLLTSKDTIEIVDMQTLQIISTFCAGCEEISALHCDPNGQYVAAVQRDSFILFALQRDNSGGVISCDKRIERFCARVRFTGALVFSSGENLLYQTPDNNVFSITLSSELSEELICRPEDETLAGYYHVGNEYFLYKSMGQYVLKTRDSKRKIAIIAKLNDLVEFEGKLLLLQDEHRLNFLSLDLCSPIQSYQIDFIPKSAVPFGKSVLITDEHGTLYTWDAERGAQSHGMLSVDRWDRNPKLFILKDNRAFFCSESRFAMVTATSTAGNLIMRAKLNGNEIENLMLNQQHDFVFQNKWSNRNLGNFFKQSPYGLTAMLNYKCDWNPQGDMLYMADGQTVELIESNGTQRHYQTQGVAQNIIDIQWIEGMGVFAVLYRTGILQLIAPGDEVIETQAFESATGNYLLCGCGEYVCVVTKRRRVQSISTSMYEETAVSIHNRKGRLVHEEHISSVEQSSVAAAVYDAVTNEIYLIQRLQVMAIRCDNCFETRKQPLTESFFAIHIGVAARDGIVYYFQRDKGLCALDMQTGKLIHSMPLHRSPSALTCANGRITAVENNELIYSVKLEK